MIEGNGNSRNVGDLWRTTLDFIQCREREREGEGGRGTSCEKEDENRTTERQWEVSCG